MIQQTSLDAYYGLRDIGLRQMQVYKALQQLREANNLMIAKVLNLPINSITPRVLELREKGIVIKSKMMLCPFTHRNTWFWRLKIRN